MRRNVEELISEMEHYDCAIGLHFPPATLDDILFSEKKIGYRLPDEYRNLLLKHNGIEFEGESLYGVGENYIPECMSIHHVYHFEHFIADNPMPSYLVPFCPDGFGNHYCFDLHRSGHVVFWQHDYEYTIDNQPELVYNDLAELLNEVFIAWAGIRDEMF